MRVVSGGNFTKDKRQGNGEKWEGRKQKRAMMIETRVSQHSKRETFYYCGKIITLQITAKSENIEAPTLKRQLKKKIK